MTLHRQETGVELYTANVNSDLAPGVSYLVQTLRHDPVASLAGAEFDSCPGGAPNCDVFRGALAALTRSAVAC
jgi:hypothetical protein